MSAPTREEIAGRYTKRIIKVDAFGRSITCRPLRPSETSKLSLILDGCNDSSLQAQARIIASVCKVDDLVIRFPPDVDDLFGTMDLLDAEGIEAATKAYIELLPPETRKKIEDAQRRQQEQDGGASAPAPDEQPPSGEENPAKNSPTAQGSANSAG